MAAVDNAKLGPLPGLMVVSLVALFFAGLLVTAFLTDDEEGALAHGDVHVWAAGCVRQRKVRARLTAMPTSHKEVTENWAPNRDN